MKEHKSTLDYNQITDNIFIGTNQCCQIHFDEELIAKGVEADISLEEKRVDKPFGVKFYTWLSTTDHTPPSPDQIVHGVAVIENLIALGKKIYVHCQKGHGRAPTLVAAYLVHTGKTVDDAIALIKEKRPVIHLDDSQVEALRVFELTK